VEEDEGNVGFEWINVVDELPEDFRDIKLVYIEDIRIESQGFYKLSNFHAGRGWTNIPAHCFVRAWCDFNECPMSKPKDEFVEIKDEKPKSWFFPWKN